MAPITSDSKICSFAGAQVISARVDGLDRQDGDVTLTFAFTGGGFGRRLPAGFAVPVVAQSSRASASASLSSVGRKPRACSRCWRAISSRQAAAGSNNRVWASLAITTPSAGVCIRPGEVGETM